MTKNQTTLEMDDVTKLPDGSAFFTASFPLPKDHWLFAPACKEWDSVRDESADCPIPILGNDAREAVKVALRYAIRGATTRGQDMDFDPDALVLNAAYALCGPCNPTDDSEPKPLKPHAAVTDMARKLGDEYFRLCKLADRKPMPAGFWMEQLCTALETVLKGK